MLFRSIVFPSILLPALVATIVHLLGGWRGARRATAPLALAAAYACAHAAISGLPRMPPPETTEWLFHLAAIAGVLALIEPLARAALPRHPDRLSEGMRYFLLGSVIWLTLRPLVAQDMPHLDLWLWLGGVGLLGLACGLAFDHLAAGAGESAADRALPAAVWVAVGAGATIALGLSSSARLAQLANAAVVAVAAGQVVCSLRRQSAFTQPAVSLALTLLVGLLFNGYLYAQLPALSAVLLAAAPVAGWLALRRFSATASALRRTLAILTAVLIPVATAVAIAGVEYRARSARDPYADGARANGHAAAAQVSASLTMPSRPEGE